MDTLYFFKYDKKGDKTEYLKKITGRQMLMVELINDPSLKGSFHIQIELKSKIYFFGFKYATVAQKWINSFRRAKKTVEEIARIKSGKIYRNIDPLIQKFRNKVSIHFIKVNLISIQKGKEIKDYCQWKFDQFANKISATKTEIPEFLRVVAEAVDDLSKMLDAIQAHRPFYKELFKLYMKQFHLQWTDMVSEYYNQRFTEFGVRIKTIAN